MMLPQRWNPAAVLAEAEQSVRGSMPRLRNFLRHRVAYGQVIPPDARVSPEEFPEDEFPVYCPGCDYLLRGLQGHYCPECGREFERGRLLVEQYVIEQGKRCCGWTSRFAWWTGLAGVVGLLAFGGGIIQAAWGRSLVSGVPFYTVMSTLMLVGILAAGFLLVSIALSLRLAFASKAKGKRVFSAIDKSCPAYKKAQQGGWILVAIWLAAMAGVFIWDLRDDDFRRWVDWSRPTRVLLPLGAAAAVGVIFFLITKARNRKHRSEDGAR